MVRISIREAKEQDFPVILSLIKELSVYEKAENKVTNSVELMKKEKNHFHCLVAETEASEIVGFALYFFAYFTWVGKSLYLDDLYVKKEFRREKIGSKLLTGIFQIAKNQNCKRVRWQVLHWNRDAIKFYKKQGAIIDSDWLNCDFDEHYIKNL